MKEPNKTQETADLVKAVRELYTLVRIYEKAHEKQGKVYIRTGVGDKGFYVAYHNVRILMEEKFSEHLEGEPK